MIRSFSGTRMLGREVRVLMSWNGTSVLCTMSVPLLLLVPSVVLMYAKEMPQGAMVFQMILFWRDEKLIPLCWALFLRCPRYLTVTVKTGGEKESRRDLHSWFPCFILGQITERILYWWREVRNEDTSRFSNVQTFIVIYHRRSVAETGVLFDEGLGQYKRANQDAFE